MTDAERREALAQIDAEVRVCTRCRLSETRTRAVPGEGSPDAEVLFVGEGPGFNEDRQGRPFCGAAGSFLDELLRSVGWERSDVFITNIVKCRPPENRDPLPDEIEACAPYLSRQLATLDPAMVVTLGRHSLGRFIPDARIGQVHGSVRPAPEADLRDGLIFAMYHPAAALHQGSLRQTLFDDMQGVKPALANAKRRRAERRGQPTSVSAPAVSAPAAVVVEAAAPLKSGTTTITANTEPVSGPEAGQPASDAPVARSDQMTLF